MFNSAVKEKEDYLRVKWNQFKLYFNLTSVCSLMLAVPGHQSQARQPDTFNPVNTTVLKSLKASACYCLRFNRGCIVNGPLRKPTIIPAGWGNDYYGESKITAIKSRN